MRITQWGEYGVHFMAFIAKRQRDGLGMVGAAEIAKNQGVELQYAQQILQRLRRGGVIESVRGPAGGYRLSRPAAAITLLDVLIATEGDSFQVICDFKPIHPDRCASVHPCGLRDIWNELKEHVDVFLRKYTVDDLSRMTNYTFSVSFSGDEENVPIAIGRANASLSLHENPE